MKNKKDIIYYVILGLIVVGMVVWEIYKPKPVDWTFYLEQEKKEPYGTYALYESLPDLFTEKEIKTEDRSVYEQSYYDFPLETNLIFISENFNPGEEEEKMLLNYADEGNHIFIAAYELPHNILYDLGLEIKSDFSFGKDSLGLNFTNKELKKGSLYYFEKTYASRYFNFAHTEEEELDIELLGFEDKDDIKILSVNHLGKAVYIKRKWGDGAFYIHLHPEVFTNFALVTQKHYDYAYKCLSYLPEENEVWWDEYYKPIQPKEYSHMKYVMKNPGLKHAYQITLILLIIYTIFTAKRRQRIIPVIKPFRNTTLEFTETVGRLYYHSKNHRDIALKKYNYWLEHIRQHYYLTNEDIRPENSDRLAEKTGAKSETIRKILRMQKDISSSGRISDNVLNEFTETVEDYYQQEK